MRIIVIEDEPALREQLAGALRRAGHTVDAAVDGTEGLYALSEYPADLAIIDLGLPGIAGLERGAG